MKMCNEGKAFNKLFYFGALANNMGAHGFGSGCLVFKMLT